MRYWKIDQLIFDDGFKGIVTRILLVFGAYFGILYLPDMVNWTSFHWHWLPPSEKQLKSHEQILFVFRIAIGFMLAMELLRLIVVSIRKRARR